MKWQMIPRNVAEAVQALKPKRPEIKVPPLEDVERLLEAAKNSRDYAAICTAIFTGMRLGELMELKWEDIDLNAGTIAVRCTLQRPLNVGLIFTDPKSQKSRRQMVIPPALIGILREHRKAQKIPNSTTDQLIRIMTWSSRARTGARKIRRT
ncbi:MAG: site-specific integrase [Thermacetogeniaceae bacterium]